MCRKGLLIVLIFSIEVIVASASSRLADQGNHDPARNPVLTLKVLTYNVQGARRSAELAQLLGKTRPDLICLQEIPGRGKSSVKTFADRVGMNFAFQPYYKKGYGGCAILARGKITGSKALTMAGERNFGMTSVVQIGPAKIKVVCVHLKSLPRPILTGFFKSMAPRAKQAGMIVDLIKDTYLPVVVAGDCNTLPFTPEYLKLQSVLQDACVVTRTTSQPSIEIDGIGYRIDHIFFRGPWQIRSCNVIAAKTSDHRPILAELQLMELPTTRPAETITTQSGSPVKP